MRQTRILTLLFILPLLILLSACGDSRLHKAAHEAFEKGDYEGAKTSATTLIQEYPTSKYASLAKEILQKIEAKEAEEQRRRAEEILKQLIEALSNRDTRDNAIKQLGELRDERAVEPLIDALKYEKTRNAVIKSLGLIGGKEVAEPLIAIIKNENEDFNNKKAAFIALAKIDTNYVLPLIGSFGINWGAFITEREVQDVIKQIGEPAVEPLIALLKKLRDYDAKGGVITILGEFRDKRAVEPLIAALRKNDGWTQYILRALGEIGDERAIEPLIERLEIERDAWRLPVLAVLEKITNQDFGRDPNKWREWYKKNKTKQETK